VLVVGLKSRIAFKAVGTNGNGVNVKGEILDNDNKPITTFISAHLGMGSFELTCESGKTYKARLYFADGTTQTIDLPKAEEKGIILSVDNDSIALAKARIMTNDAYFKENKGKNYTLLIYSGGVATTVAWPLDSTTIDLDILKRKLFTGVTTVTLFSPYNEPLCERLIFVQNYDQLSLKITSNKPIYTERGKVILKIKAKTRADSAATGHYSIAVINESKVPQDDNRETTILTDLLLTSDLKGYVEQPNYYFDQINDTTTKALDLVMLTHGYRRFSWEQILNNAYPQVVYQPENGITISGTAKNVFGKPLNHGTVSLISTTGGLALSAQTDDKGNFKFSNLIFIDTMHFVLNATNTKGKNNINLTYNNDRPQPASSVIEQSALTEANPVSLVYTENSEKQQEELNRLGLSKGKMLKEVKIKATKRPNYRSESLVPEASADQVIRRDQLLYGSALSTRLMQVARRVKWRSDSHGPNFKPDMTVYIDGVVGDIDQVRPDDVEVIEIILPPNSYIYGSDGLNGVIDITTRPGGQHAEDIISEGILPIKVQGFYKARQFYSPKYEHPNDYINRKDLRSTIYWQPELATDKDGNAEISFYNADGKGTYRVVVEGMDEKGNLGRKVFRYKVE
jgi:hypothetical protein